MIFHNKIVSLLNGLKKKKIKLNDTYASITTFPYLFFKNFSLFLVKPPETPQTFVLL